MCALKKTALAFTLITSLISLIYFHVVFDDSYDGLISNISTGQFTPFSLMDQHYLGILVIRDLYKFIQNLLPSISIFSTMYLISSILSLYYTLITLYRLPLKNQNILIVLFFSVLTSFFFIENIVSITHTRFATIFCGIALINIVWNENENFKGHVTHYFIFLFGFLSRPESGIGMIIIVGLGYLLYSFNLIKIIRKFLWPIATVFLVLIIFIVDKKFTNRYEIKIEPDVEYAFSTNRVVPIESMSNIKDSLKYEMGLNAMFIDTSFVSSSFLKSLVVNQYKLDIHKMLNSFKNIIKLNYKYNLFFISIFLLALIYLNKVRQLFFKIIVLQMLLFAIYIVLDYNVRVEDRHFASLQIMNFVISLTFSKDHKFLYKFKSNFLNLIALVTLAISSVSTSKQVLGNQLLVAEEVSCLESAFEKIEEIYQNETLVSTLSTFHLFDKKYSFLNNNYTNNRYLIYDLSNYSIVPRNLAYLSSICNCNAEIPDEFFSWAERNKILFLSTNDRFELMESYAKTALGKNLLFKVDEKFLKYKMPDCMEESVHNDYIIKFIEDFNRFE